MKKILALVLLVFFLSACKPTVVDPAKWDPTTYCHTLKQMHIHDRWCITHGH